MTNQENMLKALQKLAQNTQNNPFQMLSLAATDPRVAISIEEFDQFPDMLNCRNCIIDLDTGQSIAHDPKYLLTKQCNASYTPDAPAELWFDFLRYVTEDKQEIIDFLARLYGGVGLVGDNPERVMAILFGYGKNGKSIFSDVLRHVMGSYSDIIRQEVLMTSSSQNIKHDLADLKGARFLLASEPPPGIKLNGGIIKELTGGDQIKARHIYQNSVKFRCEGLITLVTNWEPEIEAGDAALKQRLLFIRFNKVIPEDKRDPLLGQKLKAEADGILAWLVKGRMDYLKNGLCVPLQVQQETLAYNTDADWMEQFLNSCCTIGPAKKEQAEQLYTAYSSFMISQMQGRAMLGKYKFFSLLARKYAKSRVNGLTYYAGLELTDKQNP